METKRTRNWVLFSLFAVAVLLIGFFVINPGSDGEDPGTVERNQTTKDRNVTSSRTETEENSTETKRTSKERKEKANQHGSLRFQIQNEDGEAPRNCSIVLARTDSRENWTEISSKSPNQNGLVEWTGLPTVGTIFYRWKIRFEVADQDFFVQKVEGVSNERMFLKFEESRAWSPNFTIAGDVHFVVQTNENTGVKGKLIYEREEVPVQNAGMELRHVSSEVRQLNENSTVRDILIEERSRSDSKGRFEIRGVRAGKKRFDIVWRYENNIFIKHFEFSLDKGSVKNLGDILLEKKPRSVRFIFNVEGNVDQLKSLINKKNRKLTVNLGLRNYRVRNGKAIKFFHITDKLLTISIFDGPLTVYGLKDGTAVFDFRQNFRENLGNYFVRMKDGGFQIDPSKQSEFTLPFHFSQKKNITVDVTYTGGQIDAKLIKIWLLNHTNGECVELGGFEPKKKSSITRSLKIQNGQYTMFARSVMKPEKNIYGEKKITIGSTKSKFNLVLDRGAILEGRIFDRKNGNPVKGKELMLERIMQGKEIGATLRSSKSDKNGRFIFKGLRKNGTYVLFPRDSSFKERVKIKKQRTKIKIIDREK